MIPKFRAWDKKRGGILKVNVIRFNHPNGFESTLSFDEGNGVESTLKLDDCILMQSTGLKDKNGVEIFEGDILKTRTRGFAVVKTKDGNSTVKYKSRLNSTTTATLLHFMDMNKVEVIGNIYENSELLED